MLCVLLVIRGVLPVYSYHPVFPLTVASLFLHELHDFLLFVPTPLDYCTRTTKSSRLVTRDLWFKIAFTVQRSAVTQTQAYVSAEQQQLEDCRSAKLGKYEGHIHV